MEKHMVDRIWSYVADWMIEIQKMNIITMDTS